MLEFDLLEALVHILQLPFHEWLQSLIELDELLLTDFQHWILHGFFQTLLHFLLHQSLLFFLSLSQDFFSLLLFQDLV